jgi:hypothetical protein
MCIDYARLNKACPKHEYPLPRNCQIIDYTTLCELLSFLDAYSGYHQISIAIDDLHHSIWIVLLHKDGIQPQKWRGYVSKRRADYLGDSN